VAVGRNVKVAIGIAVAALALGASFLTGRVLAPDPDVDDLGNRCRGTVPTASAKTYLESDYISVTEEVPEDDVLQCDIAPAAISSPDVEDARISVVISPAEDAVEYLVPESTDGNETAPFGSGWVGTYGPDSISGGTATLLLECSQRDGGGLVVLVSGGWSSDDHELVAQKHEQLAVVAARLARQAGQEWGCDGQPGEIPESVTVAESGYPDTPVEQARGTCEGVVSSEAARELGVERVSEVPAGLALGEDCLVYGDDETYYISASYGPAAEDARTAPWAENYQATATATCGRGQGQAYYRAEAGEGVFSQIEPPNPRAFLEMFDRFVAASAERHGCELDDQRQLDPDGEDATDVQDLAEELSESDTAENALPPITYTVRAILGMSAAVPVDDWTIDGSQAENGTEAEICGGIPDLCRGLRAHGTLALAGSPDDDEGNRRHSIDFTVLAYDTARQGQQAVQAVQGFFAQFEDARDADYMLLEPDELAHFGEDGLGVSAQDYTQLEDSSRSATVSYLAQGPYVGVLRIVDDDMSERWDLMEQLGGALAARMDEAEAGQQPSTTDVYGD
jgi:hypothetical protein